MFGNNNRLSTSDANRLQAKRLRISGSMRNFCKSWKRATVFNCWMAQGYYCNILVGLGYFILAFYMGNRSEVLRIL